MTHSSQALGALTKAIVHFEDGDVMRLANWIGLLEELRREVAEAHLPLVEELTTLVRMTIREGTPDGFIETLAQGLDAISRGQSQVDDALWLQHGPTFVSDARSRLARAQELILGLEEGTNPQAIAELFRIVHTLKGEAGFLHQTELAARSHRLEELLDSLRSGRANLDAVTIDHLLGGVDELASSLAPPPSEESPRNEGHREAAQTPTVEEILRIPAGKIDSLISLVGELLVALDSEANAPSPQVKKLSRGLQQSALRLRTEPLKDLLGRTKRGARDLARDLGKSVDIQVSGGDLELDRNLISLLEEPLMHLIRNALDHGLEPEDQRIASGKTPQGTLGLAAQRRGNQIRLTVWDDGRGLDPDRIWTKAQERGLVTGERPQDLGQVYALIFQPGFSTAEALTQVSGRGVGMDIVSSVVGANRGRVELHSEVTKGTTVTLCFPLSTAVLEGLVVRLGPRRFLLPVTAAIETIQVAQASVRSVGQGTWVYLLRGTTLPVLWLQTILDNLPASSVPTWGVVVESTDSGRFLLLVDEVESKKEVVIRSLGTQFQHLKGISAATVLAGGTLALVLDVDQLVQLGVQS